VTASIANYFVRHGWRRDGEVAFEAELRDGGEPPGLEVAVKKPLKPNTTAAALRVAGVDWRGAIASDAPVTLIRLDGADGALYWVGLDNFYVITRYNHSNLYAMAVFQLGEAVREAYEERAPSGAS
jgi:membrane-bound lytic murein transglycosylase B